MAEQNEFAKFNEAMANFQGEYTPPKKDKKVDYKTSKGQVIKYDYSDLESLQRAIRETASKHGLSWNTDFEYEESVVSNYGKEQKALVLITKVVINHSSGVEKTFKGVPLYITSFDPQSIGSVKTYSERYALSGAFGIASDSDDDGQVAKDHHEENLKNNQSNALQEKPNIVTSSQVKSVKAVLGSIAELTGQDIDAATEILLNKQNMPSNINKLNVDQYGTFMNYLNELQRAYKKRNQDEMKSQKSEQTSLETTSEKDGSFVWGPTNND